MYQNNKTPTKNIQQVRTLKKGLDLLCDYNGTETKTQLNAVKLIEANNYNTYNAPLEIITKQAVLSIQKISKEMDHRAIFLL